MDKEQRKKYLERLSRSNEGEALKDYFSELIGKLTDARNYAKEDFELEGKASIKAATVLEKIMLELKLLKGIKKERQKNPYV